MDSFQISMTCSLFFIFIWLIALTMFMSLGFVNLNNKIDNLTSCDKTNCSICNTSYTCHKCSNSFDDK